MANNKKHWFKSKTLWVNVVALTALLLQGIFGKQIISLEAQGILLGIINIILRGMTTKGVHIKASKK